MRDKSFIFKGLLAGICISLGGTINLKVGGVAGAVLFAFGLIAVITMGLNLFTGKARFVWGRARAGQYEEGGYVWLGAILLLNVAACLAMGQLMSTSALQEEAVRIMNIRLGADPLKNCVLAIGCGIIMTLAVKYGAEGKWLPLLFGIPAFIICGLPHCIADAFYIGSLPADYLRDHAAGLGVFYPAIVLGNFLGCNVYRLVEPRASAVRR